MALLQLLLEQFVAGPGAGQEQPEALEAETLGSEVSLAQGAPKEEGFAEGAGSVAWTQLAASSMPPPAGDGGRQSAELCLGLREEHVASGSHQTTPCARERSSGTRPRGPRTASRSRVSRGPAPAGQRGSPAGPGASPGSWRCPHGMRGALGEQRGVSRGVSAGAWPRS